MDYLGKDIKNFGFGLMRLPMIDGEVDIEQTKKMVDLFLSRGFTYFDTAYTYLGGKSEQAVKTVLVDRYPRESFQLATKLPAWAAKSAEEAKQMFYTSLERTGAGYFDFYLLHNLGGGRLKFFDDYGLWDFAKELKEKGLIKHFGFSIHDKAEFVDELLTKHPEVEFVQLQINYGDWENPDVQSRACYEVARKHNKPVVIMEPIKGGSLSNMPECASSILTEANPNASQSSWALRFAASLDGLITVLSGMSTYEQMEDNLSYMTDFKPLTEEEQAVIVKVREALSKLPNVPCTNCQYCVKGCPMEIFIPGIFGAMNLYNVYNNEKGARHNFGYDTKNGGLPSKCIQCGQCESVCPQHIKIIDELKNAVELFENTK